VPAGDGDGGGAAGGAAEPHQPPPGQVPWVVAAVLVFVVLFVVLDRRPGGPGGGGIAPLPGVVLGGPGVSRHCPGASGLERRLATGPRPPGGAAMRLLSRHVSATVLMSILTVLLVVVSLDAMAAIIDGIGDLKGDYGFWAMLLHVFITLPGSIYQNLPFSALIGCLIGLGMLASNSELVVMRAAGISLLRVFSFVLKPVVAL